MEKIVLNTKQKVRIFIFSDTHVGNSACDIKAVKRFVFDVANYCKDENETVILLGLGDYIDCITPDDKRFNFKEVAKEIDLNDVARMQMKEFYAIVEPAVEKVDYAIFLLGNHEEKLINQKFFNVYDYLCEDLSDGKIIKGGYESLIRLKLSRSTACVNYDIFATHGAGAGGWREGAAINYIYDVSRFYDCDTYLCGHLHRLVKKTSSFLYINSNNEIAERKRHFGIAGSFLLRNVEKVRSYMEGRRGEPSLLGYLVLSLNLSEKLMSDLREVYF
jgi:UDP-2,3-diacylglucosamine pyrophosphatase LpxH